MSVEQQKEQALTEQYMSIVEIIAYITNETLCGYCRAIGETRPSWVEMTEEARTSFRKGVLARLTYPAASPDNQHKAWLQDKARNGWVFGPNKNEELRTHPSMVPYEQLPQSERVKNEIFIANVLAAANSLL